MPPKAKAPARRTRFDGPRDEARYLYDQILHWYYRRNDALRARRYAARLSQLVDEVDPDEGSIFGAECRSLIGELQGDLASAIRHRQREIALIQRLWEVSPNTPGMAVATRDYGVIDLADRLDLLAILYHDAGDLDRAIAALMRSKWLCESFKVPFDSDDLLQDYLYEASATPSFLNALRQQGWRLTDDDPAPPNRAPHPRRTRRSRTAGRRPARPGRP